LTQILHFVGLTLPFQTALFESTILASHSRSMSITVLLHFTIVRSPLLNICQSFQTTFLTFLSATANLSQVYSEQSISKTTLRSLFATLSFQTLLSVLSPKGTAMSKSFILHLRISKLRQF
jgi:hypothetical protein